jgi:hypothetical protein
VADLPDITKEALEAEKGAVEEQLSVEVVDDTPPEDRGRKPLPKDVVKELEDDDLEEYSDKVKKRLSQMKKVWHDERREKERVTREREEAIAFARVKEQEIQELRKRLGHGERLFVEEISKAVTGEVSAAKERLKKAYEMGDADAIADAQEALTDAKVRMQEIQRRKPALLEQEKSVQEVQQAQAPSQPVSVDPKAQAWRDKNTWFGVDEEMTSLALGLHEKLVRSGVDPRSDEYYSKIDATIRKRFPENFDSDSEPEQETTEREAPVARKKPVVAAVSRTTAPSKVRLTASQVAIAKRLGLSPEVYAKEVVKLENANG